MYTTISVFTNTFHYRSCKHTINAKYSKKEGGWVVSSIQELHNHPPNLAEGPGKHSAVEFQRRMELIKQMGSNVRLSAAQDMFSTPSLPANMQPTQGQIRSAHRVCFFLP